MKLAELFTILALLFGGLYGGWGEVIGGVDTGVDGASCSEATPGALHNTIGCGPLVEMPPKLPDRRE